MTKARDLANIISGGFTEADIPNLSASKITSGTFADARISQSSVVAHSPQTDLQPIKSDISALALREATNESSAAFNLPNQFIDTFATDTIGTKTNASVSSGNVATIVSSTTYGIPMGVYNNQLNLTNGGWTGSITGDEIEANGASYMGGYMDRLFDLSQDWKIKGFYTDNSGSQITKSWGLWTAIVTQDTSIAAGNNPTIFQDSAHSNNPHPNLTPTNVAQWLTSSYYSTLGVSGITDNYANGHSGSSSRLSVNASGTTTHARGYVGNYARYGVLVEYDRSADTITISPQATTSGFETSDTSNTRGAVTFTNVPSTGRFMFVFGHDANNSDRVSSTFNSSDSTKFGSYATTTANATGSIIQAANTVGSAKTKVGGTILYKDNEGTATLGTDLKVYFTCNGGSNWTEAASYNAITPVYSTGIKQVRLGETTCTSGTDVRYKVEWANQALGSKETQLHGIGINY